MVLQAHEDACSFRLIALQFGWSTKIGLYTITNASVASHAFSAWLPSLQRQLPPSKWTEAVRPPAAQLCCTRLAQRIRDASIPPSKKIPLCYNWRNYIPLICRIPVRLNACIPYWLQLINVVLVLCIILWHGGRTSVLDRRTFPVLRSTYSWRVTAYVGKPSAI